MPGKYLFSLIIIVFALYPAIPQTQTGGYYPTVTARIVERLQLERYDTANKKGQQADFEWQFLKDEFVVKKGKGAIPADLISKLLSNMTTADEIRGKWAIGNGGQNLILTEIKTGETAGNKKVTLTIEQTGIGVIRIGDPEYVFGLKSINSKPSNKQ